MHLACVLVAVFHGHPIHFLNGWTGFGYFPQTKHLTCTIFLLNVQRAAVGAFCSFSEAAQEHVLQPYAIEDDGWPDAESLGLVSALAASFMMVAGIVATKGFAAAVLQRYMLQYCNSHQTSNSPQAPATH